MMVCQSGRFNGVVPALGLPTIANTKMLLHFDGADGATATVDAVAAPHTITFNGNAQLDTGFKKFGTAALLLDGIDDYLGSWLDAGMQFGADEFSIFAWIRPTATNSVRTIIHHGYPSACSWAFTVSAGTLAFGWSNVGGTTQTGNIQSGAIIAANQLQLVGVTRAADGTIRLFHALDGAASVAVVASLNDATTNQTFNTAGSPVSHIGIYSGAINDYAGTIDEFILTKECLATAEFLMPTSAFAPV